MPQHAVELLGDAATDAAVRADWAALRAAGLPSGLDHRGATHAPHVTLVAADGLGDDLLDAARRTVLPLLPLTVTGGGLAVLGRRRLSLVRLLDVPDALVAAVLALRARVVPGAGPALQPPRSWTPHLTLARGLAAADLSAAVAAVGVEGGPVVLAGARVWDPTTGTVRPLDA